MSQKRNRAIYGIITLFVILLGLASRLYLEYLPSFLASYAGDTLWGLMVFLGIAFVFNQKPAKWVFIAAIIFSFSIELSQLYQAEWINSIRHTVPGGLILGFGFLWSDLISYFIGISIGVLFEKTVMKKLFI